MLKIRFTASDSEQLTKGFMFSEPLNINECALFIFKNAGEYSFWNKNVDYPISLFFLDENFKVCNIGVLEAHQEKPCSSLYPFTKYVIEGHKDLIEEKTIESGDFCLIDKNLIKIVKGNSLS